MKLPVCFYKKGRCEKGSSVRSAQQWGLDARSIRRIRGKTRVAFAFLTVDSDDWIAAGPLFRESCAAWDGGASSKSCARTHHHAHQQVVQDFCTWRKQESKSSLTKISLETSRRSKLANHLASRGLATIAMRPFNSGHAGDITQPRPWQKWYAGMPEITKKIYISKSERC